MPPGDARGARGRAPGIRQRVERLRAIPLLGGLSRRSLGRAARLMTEFEAPAGQVLIQRGMPGAGLFLVEDGIVVVDLPGGRALELGRGEFVGELSLLTEDGARTARVRAKTAVTGLALSRKDFTALLEDEPRIAVAMLPVLAGRLAEGAR